MADRNISGKIIQAFYTTEELSQEPLCNIVIDKGLVIYEKCVNEQVKMKIGDGVNTWSHLEYIEKKSEINDESFSSNTTYSSTKIEEIINDFGNLLNDSLDNMYTSEQVNGLLNDKLNTNAINDTLASSTTIYSSSKVENLINETNSNINNTLSESKTYTDTKVSNLVGSAPETLNTLEEVAKAIEENEDVVSALNSAIGNKANQSDLNSLETEINELKNNATKVTIKTWSFSDIT